MDETKKMQEKLIKEFTEEYMEALFYFCLKKTGDSEEAQDLTQDIALNILTALNGKTIPANFSAWVWKIARNRYSVWADRKHRRAESVTGNHIADYEIEDENTDILESVIHSEQLALLREGLAFISRDYRDIVVAFYIEDRSVRDIAEKLSLSQDTVKQRLHRARKILKEGMNMAREFGRLSFKPENIILINDGRFGLLGEPWYYLNRMLCKNICLAAYRTPSTAEELAIEVGVALPYMEAELENMVEGTLMKKNGNKYETNFFIVSAAAQEKILAHLQGILPELTESVTGFLEGICEWRNKIQPEWHGGYQSVEDMRWALLMQVLDGFEQQIKVQYRQGLEGNPNIGQLGHTIRPNNGEWDVVGMEEVTCDRADFVGLHNNPGTDIAGMPNVIGFGAYQFRYKELCKKKSDTVPYAEAYALWQIAKGNAEQVNESILKHLEEEGYIVKGDNGYEPQFLVMYMDKEEKIAEVMQQSGDELAPVVGDACKKAVELVERHYQYCREQIYKEIPDFLKENEQQIAFACESVCHLRGAVLEEAIRQGYLTYEEEKDNRMLGVYLYV